MFDADTSFESAHADYYLIQISSLNKFCKCWFPRRSLSDMDQFCFEIGMQIVFDGFF